MADTSKTPPPTAQPGAPPAQAVAKAAPLGPAPIVPAQNDAARLAIQNGGLPTAKPRKDGFKHGSKEAIAADRETARVQKAAQRARLRAATTPPALPPAGATGPALPDQNQTLLSNAGAEGLDQVAPLVPWTGEDLAPALLDTLELLEDADRAFIEGKLEKAHLSAASVKEVMADAAWPERSKKGISRYGAQALAKGLNALGLSAKHKDVALVLPSVAYLIADRAKLHRRLDALVKAANPPTAQPGASPQK